MADFPAMPLWTDAYLADTRHLSTHQHGAYLLLLMSAWRHPECSLPDCDRTLARLAGMNAGAWARCKPVVMAFFAQEDDGRWRQKRLSKERSYVKKRIASQSAKGKASAEAKRRKKQGLDSTGVDAQRQPNGNPASTPTPKKNSLPKGRESSSATTLTPTDAPGGLRAEGATPDAPAADVLKCVRCKTERAGHLRWTKCDGCGDTTKATADGVDA